ncbi:uncharacterized protein LOC134743959 [Cydia strobilella]|uniref:uncharacterized protein LOC134743959 n=1 Tax=Cydia strobilella TaxID=1100964 RepID=UPI003007964C
MCRVWTRFQATRSDGTSVKLRIEDLSESRFEDAVELFIQYFVLEETFHKAVGVARNPQAVAEARVIVTESMKDPAYHYVICCEDRDDDEVGQTVGASSIELTTIGPEPFEGIKLESDEMQKMFEMLAATTNLHIIMEELHISIFYDDRGMIVHPEFRQLGIAREFLKTRCLACVTNNVPATGALMTSIATQKAAEKDNWETVLEVDLQEFGRKHGVTFEDGGVSKLMIWKNPQYKAPQKIQA